MKYRCESFKLLLFRLLSSAIAKQPRNELFILQSDWKCFAFCCRINISSEQDLQRKENLLSFSGIARRQTTIAQVAHKSMQKRNVSGIRAVVKMRPFPELNKLQNVERRFNLSYYDLHTADAHIDLFELEVKRRRPGQPSEEARNQNVKRTGIEIVTRRIGDLLESRSGGQIPRTKVREKAGKKNWIMKMET